jgi:peptidoglycan hydrolase CwlO-like protein
MKYPIFKIVFIFILATALVFLLVYLMIIDKDRIGQSERIEKLEKQMDFSEQRDVYDRVAKLENKVDALEKNADYPKKKAEELENKVGELEKKVEDLIVKNEQPVTKLKTRK